MIADARIRDIVRSAMHELRAEAAVGTLGPASYEQAAALIAGRVVTVAVDELTKDREQYPFLSEPLIFAEGAVVTRQPDGSFIVTPIIRGGDAV